MNSISIVQVGNSWDPYLQDNSFSLNYSSLTLQTNYNYGYISVLTNTYEGCLITLLWNKVYSASYTAQLDRATYTIKKHLNAMNEPTTEFQTVNRYIYNYTASSYATIQNTYRPSCGFTKYMWMPSKKLFFFMDYTSNNWYLVFTCFPYNTAPSKACDADFDQSGTPTFKIITLNTYTGYGSYLNLVNTMTFTRGYGYTAWQYYWLTSYYDYYYGYSTVTHWQWHIFRHVFSGSSCSDYGVSRDSDVYDGEDSSAYSLSSVLVVPYYPTVRYIVRNVGIAFIKSNAAGIYTVPLDNSTGLNALGSYSAVVLRSDCTWKLYQQSIDSTEDPPLFGISSCDKFSIYRITTVATLIYTNSTLNFYDYTCDVGRAHFIVVHPGTCSQLLAAANYEYAHVTYVNLETLQADFCNMDKPRTTTTSAVDSSACGNGVIDYGEECDDGNKRSGDGCNSTCLIEAGWRCSSSPYQIICNESPIVTRSSTMREERVRGRVREFCGAGFRGLRRREHHGRGWVQRKLHGHRAWILLRRAQPAVRQGVSQWPARLLSYVVREITEVSGDAALSVRIQRDVRRRKRSQRRWYA